MIALREEILPARQIATTIGWVPGAVQRFVRLPNSTPAPKVEQTFLDMGALERTSTEGDKISAQLGLEQDQMVVKRRIEQIRSEILYLK